MTTWVLLRGLAREARHWGEFPARLQSRLPPGDAVVALDLPGNGTRWQERSPVHVDGMVAAARAELATLPHRPPYVFVAVSLGAMVALQWASQDRGHVLGCVLINSSAGRLSPIRDRLRPGAWPALARLLLPGQPAGRRETGILKLTSSLPVSQRTAAAWTAYAHSRPVRHANFARQLLAAARYRPPLQPPAVPLLLLASQGDRLVSHRCSQAMAQAWRAPLRVHPTAGHDLPLDDPDWVLDLTVGWYGLVLRQAG